MSGPRIDSPMSAEVPEGAIFLPVSHERRLKTIEAALFSLFVPNRSVLDQLSLAEKTVMHEQLTTERDFLLGELAVRS